MNKHNIKRILICLVLLACVIGASSAAEDVSVDDVAVDAVAVDAISEDASDTISTNTLSDVSSDLQINYTDTSEELTGENVVEKDSESAAVDSEQNRATSVNAADWATLSSYCSSTTDYSITLTGTSYTASSTISFNNNAIIKGTSTSYITGGGIFTNPFKNTNSDLTITFLNVKFKNMRVSNLCQLAGTNIFENCTFDNITTGSFHNSIIWNTNGLMNITSCNFTNNKVNYGAVTNYDSSSTSGALMNVDKCKFINNSASVEPGAINNCGILNVTDSEFTNNYAANWAGAIHTHSDAQTKIVNCAFDDNLAGTNGGALYTYSKLEVYDSNFTNNNCTTNNGGGAIGAYSFGSTYNITIDSCNFIRNINLCEAYDENSTTSLGRGGAIGTLNAGYLSVSNTNFTGNYARIGQAICAATYTVENGTNGDPSLKIYNNRFINHTGENDTVLIYGNDIFFENNTFINSVQTVIYTVSGNVYNPSILSLENSLNTKSTNKKNILKDSGSITVSSYSELTNAINNDGISTIYIEDGVYDKIHLRAQRNLTLIANSDNVVISNLTTYFALGEGIPNTVCWTFINIKNIGNLNINGNLRFINCTFSSNDIQYQQYFNTEDERAIQESAGYADMGYPEYNMDMTFNATFENCTFKDGNSDTGVLKLYKRGAFKFNNCSFEDLTADSIIAKNGDLVHDDGIYIYDCSFSNVNVKGIVDIPGDIDVEDYCAIENCDYDFAATTDIVSTDEYTHNYINATVLKEPEEATNIIYVSTTGSDENDGSSAANAVATINHALEIAANSTETDFTISVAAGEYTSTTIESPADKNINLIGADRDTTIIHIPDQTYGINVYQDGVNWTIENLTVCDVASTATRSVGVAYTGDGGSFYMNNCVIKNIYSKYGAFTVQTDGGVATLNNTIIENIYATAGSSSLMYFNGKGTINLDNIEVHGFALNESYVSDAAYARTLFYVYGKDDVINLMNSKITDNAVALYSGFIESKSKFNIINTTFANNYINSSANGYNGGQYMFWSGTSSSSASAFNFTQCTIVNNTIAKTGYGIFNLVYGTHNIDHSVIMNNVYANGDDVPIGSVSGATLTADNNYWGTNERPNTRTSQWVILTADVPEYAFVGVDESIPIYLNTYNNTAGETGEVTGMADVTLDVAYSLNEANPASVTISNGQGTINYVAAVDGDETITLSTGDAFSFEVNADVSTLIYVDGSVETTGTGTSESPFKTIAEALNVAADGKIIVIRSGTYNEKDLVIDDDITIKADKGANVIIDANKEGRIFTVTSTATIRDLTLINGLTTSFGGAIYLNDGNLTLNKVNIYNSTATNGGAVVDTGNSKLTVTSSQFIDNNATGGGAIYTAGNANITNSKFISNDPDMGGAIYVAGSANIESNEFTSNQANKGGAIYIESTSPQTIADNTFSSNVADHNEAIYIKNAPVELSGNTLGDNEVIYLESGSVKTNLKFLGGNSVTAEFGQTLDLTATLTDDNGNAIRGGSVTFTANGETVATVDLSGDNELKTSYTTPLTADGDIAISGSYSLDNGGSVVGGSIHLAVPHWFIEGGNGYETLAEAVAAANDGDVIYGLPGTYVVNGISTDKDITIKANETGTVILDADKSKMFTFSTLADVNLVNLTFINGPSVQGGFVSSTSSGAINLINCTFKDTSSTADGAAISASYTKLNVDSCVFENISAKAGVIAFTGNSGTLNISNSVFNNLTGSYDGFIISTKAPTKIENSNFTNLIGPTGSYYYGAIYATGAMNITGSKFVNITGPKGAVIYSTGALNVTKSVFDTITTDYSVIYASSSSTNVNYNIFVNNNKGIDSSYVKADYNFWGTNDKPSSSIISSSRYTYWTIVE